MFVIINISINFRKYLPLEIIDVDNGFWVIIKRRIMKIFVNILKFTLGLPMLVLLTFLWFMFAIVLYAIMILPLNKINESEEHFKDAFISLKDIWHII